VYNTNNPDTPISYPNDFFITVAFTTVSWLAVTFLTKPTDQAVLAAFYRKIQPEGAWGKIREQLNIPKQPSELPSLAVKWLMGIGLVYSFLFFIGKFILMEYTLAGVFLLTFLGCGWYLFKKL